MSAINFKQLIFRHGRREIIYLSFAAMIISLIEAVGISIIVLFISIAADTSLIKKNTYLNEIYEFTGDSETNFIFYFGLFAIAFYILRGVLTYYHHYRLSFYIHRQSVKIANILYKKYLQLPYIEFIKKNSSNITKILVHETSHLTSILSAVLILLSEALLIALMTIVIFLVDFKITFVLSFLILFILLPIAKLITTRVKIAGKNRDRVLSQYYEMISRSFNNYKLIRLSSNEDIYYKNFEHKGIEYSDANITNARLANVPRIFLETTSFVIIGILILILISRGDTNLSKSIGIISMYVLAFYRIMPSLSRIMNSYTQIAYYSKSSEIISNEYNLKAEDIGFEEIKYEESIRLKNIYFHYIDGKNILNDINISIPKGSIVGISGESGSGKSTLIDILCGIHRQTSGEVWVGNQLLNSANIGTWRKKIAYIPQNSYLFDGTVAENIAFDEKIDEARVISVLKKVGLFGYFENQFGIETTVGEGGNKLSGGQRQRIALARAFYRNADILVLDEATSGLDAESENEILNEIYNNRDPRTTIIIVSHRINTLNKCHVRLSIDKGHCHELFK